MNRNNDKWLEIIRYWASLDEKIVTVHKTRIEFFKYIKNEWIDKPKSYDQVKELTLNKMRIKTGLATNTICRLLQVAWLNTFREFKKKIIEYKGLLNGNIRS